MRWVITRRARDIVAWWVWNVIAWRVSDIMSGCMRIVICWWVKINLIVCVAAWFLAFIYISDRVSFGKLYFFVSRRRWTFINPILGKEIVFICWFGFVFVLECFKFIMIYCSLFDLLSFPTLLTFSLQQRYIYVMLFADCIKIVFYYVCICNFYISFFFVKTKRLQIVEEFFTSLITS
jgi:hypothetical protein